MFHRTRHFRHFLMTYVDEVVRARIRNHPIFQFFQPAALCGGWEEGFWQGTLEQQDNGTTPWYGRFDESLRSTSRSLEKLRSSTRVRPKLCLPINSVPSLHYGFNHCRSYLDPSRILNARKEAWFTTLLDDELRVTLSHVNDARAAENDGSVLAAVI